MATDKLVDFDHVTDYISREAAYKTLTEYYHHSSGVQHTVLREALNRVPTADVRPVVLCRDCVYYNTTGCADGFGWCEGVMVSKGTSDDFFCAEGKQNPYECGADMRGDKNGQIGEKEGG